MNDVDKVIASAIATSHVFLIRDISDLTTSRRSAILVDLIATLSITGLIICNYVIIRNATFCVILCVIILG